MSAAIQFDPDAAAATLLAEQTEREKVVRDLAASYSDVLHREHDLDQARATHLQLRLRAAEFGITDTALKKAGIPTISGTKSPRTRKPRRTASAHTPAAPTSPPQTSPTTDGTP